MPRDQFILAEALPHFDIDAVAIRDAKQPLRAAHDGADALVLRVGKLDAGYGIRIGTGNTSDISGVLRVEQALLKAAISHGGVNVRVAIGRRGRGKSSRCYRWG
nr:hypothetical protein [Luteibacter rhizovicinus]